MNISNISEEIMIAMTTTATTTILKLSIKSTANDLDLIGLRPDKITSLGEMNS